MLWLNCLQQIISAHAFQEWSEGDVINSVIIFLILKSISVMTITSLDELT